MASLETLKKAIRDARNSPSAETSGGRLDRLEACETVLLAILEGLTPIPVGPPRYERDGSGQGDSA